MATTSSAPARTPPAPNVQSRRLPPTGARARRISVAWRNGLVGNLCFHGAIQRRRRFRHRPLRQRPGSGQKLIPDSGAFPALLQMRSDGLPLVGIQFAIDKRHDLFGSDGMYGAVHKCSSADASCRRAVPRGRYGKQFLKRPPRAKEPRPDGIHGNAEDRRNLLIAQLFVFPQHHHLAVESIEFSYCFAKHQRRFSAGPDRWFIVRRRLAMKHRPKDRLSPMCSQDAQRDGVKIGAK